jgi:hypothetical protein
MPTDTRKIFSFTLVLSVVDFKSGYSWLNIDRATASLVSTSMSVLPSYSIIDPVCLNTVSILSGSPPPMQTLSASLVFPRCQGQWQGKVQGQWQGKVQGQWQGKDQ